MLKKFLGLTLLLLTATLCFYSVPFIYNDNTVTCINGKSSGSFVNGLLFCDNDGCFVTLSKNQAFNFAKNLNCKTVYIEKIGEITNYYFYTDKLLKKQVVKGKKVNIHIAVNGDRVTLGYPFIYGSY